MEEVNNDKKIQVDAKIKSLFSTLDCNRIFNHVIPSPGTEEASRDG